MPRPPTSHNFSRRRFLRSACAGIAAPAALGYYVTEIEPFWPEFHELPMSIPGLPSAFEGARVAHLTDLHVASNSSYDYVRGVIKRVNDLQPDLVLLTGDLVTLGRGWVRQGVDLAASLKPKTFVSFGNHDYARVPLDGGEVDTAEFFESRLSDSGHTVLRNRSADWVRGGERLQIVGLEDLWSGRFSPATAFASVDPARPAIALSHNPDTAAAVQGYRPAWILAGHTHGGQIRIPFYGAILLPIQHRQWQKGLIQLPSSRLYVSRGIGFLARTRFCCRPEVPLFTLTREANLV